MKYFRLLLITTLLCSTQILFSQQQTITGKVTDSKTGKPIAGVSVREKASKKGTTTDNNGVFALQASTQSEFEFSIVGYKTASFHMDGRTHIDVTLEAEASELGQVVFIGTRRPGRVKTETPVPVDVVNVPQIALPTARMDLTSILNYTAPSFNYNKQSGSDGADHIDLATLRGLGPDQTLVLINGKRRHQTAFVAVFGTRGRGNSGTDLSAIPIGAIDRVEILRDGASAQYGSDAIAGVINIILKKNVNQFTGNIGYAAYYDKKYNPQSKKEYQQYVHEDGLDGNAITFNGNYGVPIGKSGGFMNFTLGFLNQEKTYRQALDTNPSSEDFMYTNIYRRAHGDGSLFNIGGFVNSEIPLKDGKTSFYFNTGYNYKKSDAYAFTRNWSARPDRFPTDMNGDMIPVPGIILQTGDGEDYFNPHIQTVITDANLTAGFKGRTLSRWNWDIGNTIGSNNFHFYGDKTFNASLGANQTHFDDGGFNFLQNTLNVNFVKEFDGIGEGFNLALGAEGRIERYRLFAGEEASYTNYDPTGEKATGSQGFPGYQPGDEVNTTRSVVGAYIDAEIDITQRFLLAGAIRVENYSDFGFTHNYKLATRIKASDNFNIRGSVSTGFRAPSLQQINFSSTFTTVQGGNIQEVKIAPNYSPITVAAGIPALNEEKSLNASLGFTWRPSRAFNITLDGYWVQVKDRVVLSGQFSVDDPSLDPDLINAMQNLDVALAQFFANAVNTTNRGIDIVMEYNKALGTGSFRGLLAANFQKMDIDQINVPDKLNDTEEHRKTFLSDREQFFILASAPESKVALNLEYAWKSWTIGTRLTYFGSLTLLGYGEDGLGIDPMVPNDDTTQAPVPDRYEYGAKLVTDAYMAYRFTPKVSLYWGVDNLLNVHPDLGINPAARGWAFNNETGGPWDAVQMGGNGLRAFVRLGVSF